MKIQNVLEPLLLNPGSFMVSVVVMLLSAFWPWQDAMAQADRSLRPYLAPNKLYALQVPAGWSVAETSEPGFFRIQVKSPDGTSAVDFAWAPNAQGRSNAVQYLLAYRQLLGRACRDVTFTDVHASRAYTQSVAVAAFTCGGVAVKGRYYFESTPRGLSAQGYFAPERLLASQRVLLLNVMSSLAFIKKDQRPEPGGAEPQYYRPELVARRAGDGSMSMKVPTDWEFIARAGRVVTGARGGGPGFIYTSFQGVPMVPNASIAQGLIGSRYLPPPQTLTYILRAFGHGDIRIAGAVQDARTSQAYLVGGFGRADAQDMVAYWTSPEGMPCVGAFKLINTLPSAVGVWTTVVSGIWAPEKDAYLYVPALEEIANSFSINDRFAKEYVRAGMERLKVLQAQTRQKMAELNRAREQNQRDWEERQRIKEFSDSKWDDYRRGNTYWVSDLEGGKVYATDPWGTRDTVTGDYYEGGRYNWTNFQGENPRWPENMREISSYELKQMPR